MSAGRKSNPEPSPAAWPFSEPAASAANPDTQSLSKSARPENKAGFAQGNYYRQGVLVPGGPPKSVTTRGKNR